MLSTLAPLLIASLLANMAEPQLAATSPAGTSQEQESAPAAPLAPAATANEPPLPLAPPSDRRQAGTDRQPPQSPARALTTILSSLAIVLGLFFLVIWIARRTSPKTSVNLPSEVVEMLGRTTLTGRQYMHLVRIGNKLILLSVTPGGAETLTEITDPLEVDRLSGICRENQPGSVTATFRQVLAQFNNEPATNGFLESGASEQPALAKPSGRRMVGSPEEA